jgi:hypothetical protein
MAGQRYAVLIGNSAYPADRIKLPPLRCPVHDVDGLAELLSSEQHGSYQVTKLTNCNHHEIRRALYRTIRNATDNDLVLVYYSGHGKLDQHGTLYLAASDTAVEMLPPTAVSSEDIRNFIRDCTVRSVVVVLDCCFSGAVKRGLEKGASGDQAAAALQSLKGEGIFYLTASTDVQLAEEKEGDQYSLLTKHIIAGIAEGRADSDDDGLISFNELRTYVQQEVRREGSQQPRSWVLDVEGDVTIALSGRPAFQARKEKVVEKLLKLGQDKILTEEKLSALLGLVSQPASTQISVDRTLKVADMLQDLFRAVSNDALFLEKVYRYAPGVVIRQPVDPLKPKLSEPHNGRPPETLLEKTRLAVRIAFETRWLRVGMVITVPVLVLVVGVLTVPQNPKTTDSDRYADQPAKSTNPAPSVTGLDPLALAKAFYVPDLGTRIVYLTKEQSDSMFGLASAGAMVLEVESEKPAGKGGLQAGDVIVSIGGENIETGDDLRRAIHNLHAGKTPFAIRRGNQVKKLIVDCPGCK